MLCGLGINKPIVQGLSIKRMLATGNIAHYKLQLLRSKSFWTFCFDFVFVFLKEEREKNNKKPHICRTPVVLEQCLILCYDWSGAELAFLLNRLLTIALISCKQTRAMFTRPGLVSGQFLEHTHFLSIHTE